MSPLLVVVWCLSILLVAWPWYLSLVGAVSFCTCGGAVTVSVLVEVRCLFEVGTAAVCTVYIWLCGFCLGLVRCLPLLYLKGLYVSVLVWGVCLYFWLRGQVFFCGLGVVSVCTVLVVVHALSVYKCGGAVSFCGWYGVCLYWWVVWCLVCG